MKPGVKPSLPGGAHTFHATSFIVGSSNLYNLAFKAGYILAQGER